MTYRKIGWMVRVLALFCFALYLPFLPVESAQETQQFLPMLGKPSAPYTLRIHEMRRVGEHGDHLYIVITNSVQTPLSVRAYLYKTDRSVYLTPVGLDCGRGGCSYEGWEGTISLEDLPSRQSHHLIIEGIDAQGRVTELIHPFFYDALPRLTIHMPSRYGTANPTFPLHVTCTDDDPAGCASIEVKSEEGELLARADGGVFSQTLDLSARRGQLVPLVIVGTDRNGQTSGDIDPRSPRLLIFAQSPSLQQVAQVPGLIMDADAQRILYVSTPPTGYADPNLGDLWLYDRTTEQHQFIEAQVYLDSWSTRLFSQGALFRKRDANEIERFYEWRDGQVQALGMIGQWEPLIVGDYTIWYEEATYFLRDLRTGTTTAPIASEGPLDLDLAANGDIVFSTGAYSRLMRYRAGTITELTPPHAPWYSSNPETDGTSIVYGKVYTSPEAQIAVIDPGGESHLLPENESDIFPYFYDINNGWILYRKSGTAESWLISPERVRYPMISPAPYPDSFRLGPAGEVIYSVQGRFLLERPASQQAPIDLVVSAMEGHWHRSLWWDDKTFITVGNTLFEVIGP